MPFDKAELDQLGRNFAQLSAPDRISTLTELFPTPFVFEWAVAASSYARHALRLAFKLDPTAIPTALNGFYSTAFARLAAAPLLPQLVDKFDRDHGLELAQRQRNIAACFEALTELNKANLVSGTSSSQRQRSKTIGHLEDGGFPEAVTSPVDTPDQGDDGFFVTRHSQGAKKRARRATMTGSKSAVDDRAFQVLRLAAPINSNQVPDIGRRVLRKLVDNVELVFKALKSNDCVAALQHAVLVVSVVPSSPVRPKRNTGSPISPLKVKVEAAKTSKPANEAPVKSIKGALYLENIKELGPWRILISSRADRDLRQARNRDRKMFQTYLKKIKELSHGHFSDDNQKRLTGSNIPIPIYEAKMTADTRLVYRVDCIPEYGSDVERQVLVIYGIYTHAQLDRGAFWNSVGLQISQRGREYRRRCTARSEPIGLKGDSVYAPISFPEMDTTAEETIDLSGLSIPQHDLSELHELLVLEKFVPLSQALLNSMVANIDVMHPFNPSPSEKKIIEHPGSCYVIGRSGTGKTTTLLFRILGRERTFKKEKDITRKPRQLFITQSRVLAGKVEEFYWKLHDSIDIADHTPEALKQPGGGADIMARHTKHVKDLLHQDDVKNYRSDLPGRFSELCEEHFPLFLTMDRLFEMLEADAAAAVSTSPTSAKKAPTANSPVQSTVKTGFAACHQLLSYKIWRTEYWPHFAEHLTKGLDSALVYSEIMGVIKGSEESLLHAQRHLDFKAYESFSARRQSTFANQRKRIYDLFEAYQRQKRDKGHFDAADRTHAILSQIQNDTKVIGQPLDYLYVDEAQDNLLIDAFLLRAICCNPDGLFWAGDTAQTISVGSSFRFNDLRAFLHRVEEKRVADANKAEAQEAPALFQLTVNYRSHGGIVSCAHSLITLITRFWPDSIDNLATERGVVEGARPVFFTGWSDGNARYDQFLFGSKDERIDFGARQCIIVRNEEAQAKLRAEVGEIGIIFTVMEAKGLEFDDVLIYNFFNDSSVTEQQWRVVLNALVGTLDDQNLAAPEFDAIRHASVCADLKSLYVAVTRARKNMWIVDRSEKGEPMRMVWTSNDQVQNCTPDTKVPHIAVRSTDEEWSAQARHLFELGRFSQARHCFERATQPHHAAVAHAYYLRSIADDRVVSASKKLQDERAQAYFQAGEAFEAAATSEDWEFNPRERAGYFRNAGECLQKAEQILRAANCFEKAGEFMTAATLYRKVVHFDAAVRVIRDNSLDQEPAAQAIIKAAKLCYFKDRDISKGCELFDDPNEAVEYLEECGLDVAQADVLEHMKRWAEAADVHLQEGRPLVAAETLLKDSADQSAVRARDIVIQVLSQQVAFGRIPKRADPAVQQILHILDQLRDRDLTSSISEEVNFFNIVLRKDINALRDFCRKMNDASASQRDDVNEEQDKLLLALHLYFQARPSKDAAILGMTTDMIVSRFKLTLSLVRLLRAAGAVKDALSSDRIQRLFGFRPHGDRQYIVTSRTFLHNKLESMTPLLTVHDGVLVSEDQLSRAYQDNLLKLTENLVEDLTALFSQKGALDIPCMQMFFSGACLREDCPNEHIREENFKPSDYVLRVQAHILPLMILAAVDGLIPREVIFKQERIWSEKLYAALRPATSKMGDPSMLDVAELSRPGALAWLRPQLYDLQSSSQGHLTAAVRHAFFVSTYFGDAGQARRLLEDTPLLKKPGAIRINAQGEGDLAVLCAMDAISGPVSIKDCFIKGIDFLQLVLERGHKFEVSAFMDMFEDVMTNFFVAMNILTGSKNSVTFPRNWLLAALRRNPCPRARAITHISRLVAIGQDYILQLLHPVHSGLYYVVPHRPISLVGRGQMPHTVRNILASRMCNALCLVGINSHLPGLQKDVVAAVQVLQRQPSRSQYEKYHRAREWSDLVTITRHYFSGSKLDCMVQVSRNKLNTTSLIIMQNGVFQVTFDSWDDLRARLRGIVPGQVVQIPAKQSIPTVAPPAAPSVVPPLKAVTRPKIGESGRHGVLSPTKDLAEPTTAQCAPAAIVEETPADERHNEDGLVVDIADALQTRINVPIPVAAANREEEEGVVVDEEPVSEPTAAAMDGPAHHAAARCIQTWARDCLRRHRAVSRRVAPINGDLISYFKEYCKAAQNIQFGTGYYRLLMLGPLPHVMLALQLAEIKIKAAKVEVKKQFQGADPALPTFEAFEGQLTETSKAWKELKAHREKLKPSAPLHTTRDVQQLEQLVLSCLTFLRGLPSKVPKFYLNGIEIEMLVAKRGILDRPPPPVPPPELPTLNTLNWDDDDDDY